MSEIEAILRSGKSERDDSAPVVGEAQLAAVSAQLPFPFPPSYAEFVRLGGLAELRVNHRVLAPAEVLESLSFVDLSRYVPFADNGCGDLYCWEKSNATEPPVVFADHETGKYTLEASSFVEWLRGNRF